MSKKLNQILAIEKATKTKAYEAVTTLHKATQKADLFEGFSKTFQPTDEQGHVFPPESKKVTLSTEQVLGQLKETLVDLMDVTAAKDWANTLARGDVVVQGQKVLEGVPATYLLFLDKQLTDLHTLFSKFAELDPSVDWEYDSTTGYWKSAPAQTHRTEKRQEPLVMYPATAEHPAQTQLIVKDVVIGHWTTVKFSGAMPKPVKSLILSKISKLQRAVKEALEHANSVTAQEQQVGQSILDWILA